MTSKSQLKASAKYDKANTKQVVLKLNLKTDALILRWLDQQSNKQGYIKQLIADDINEHSKITKHKGI